MQRSTANLHLDSIVKTMKKLLLISAIFFTVTVVYGQTTFQKTYGGTSYDGAINYDEILSVQQTTDGGFVIVGTTGSFGAGGYDVYLLKTDGSGNTLWTKTFGGTNGDYGYSVQQTNDGGFVIAGYTQSFGAGGRDVYLIKTDGSGNTLWTKTFGGTNYDVGYSVQQTNDGGFVIAGTTESFGAGGADVYLIKTDGNGDTLWTKTFGGINFDYGYSVQQTNDGGFVIAASTMSFGVGNTNVYLIKTDGSGNVLWTKTFGGVGSDEGSSVQQTNDGGFIMVGYTFSFGAGNWDVYLIKTDGNGDTLWTKTYGGWNFEDGNCVRQTTDGGYIITGATLSFGAGNWDVYLIKTDGSGNALWTKTFGGTSSDYGYFVQQTTDGGFVIAGYTYSFGAGNADFYLIKTDSNGSSGCNENNAATVVTAPADTVTNPVAQVSSGGIVGNTGTQTGNGGVVTTLCASAVGVNEFEPETSVSVYPNPFSTQTTLQMSANHAIPQGGTDNHLHNATLTVYNCFGQTVKQIKNISGQTVILSRDNLASGLYFVRLTEENKTIAVDKLVITDK